MTQENLSLMSWNVNGLRAIIKKGFYDFVQIEKPDILCLQEIKARPEQVDLELRAYDYHYWHPAEKAGYSGTAIFSKIKPINVTYGIGFDEHDKEGRVITAEFGHCFLVTVYTPNSQRELARLDYRTKEWDTAFLNYVKTLEKKKPVIFCGDLNVAHKEIDLANPQSNRRCAGFTDEERAGFDRIVDEGFVDTFREFTSEGGHYTWWSYQSNARARNVGWRIDYFVVSPSLKPKLHSSEILPHVLGSDHCPVRISIASDLFL